MKTRVSKSEFRSKADAYIRQVELTGVPLTITHRGVDVLEVVKYEVASHPKKEVDTDSLDAPR